MVLIPLVFGFVSYILYQKFYKLDEKTYADICAQLETKEQEPSEQVESEVVETEEPTEDVAEVEPQPETE